MEPRLNAVRLAEDRKFRQEEQEEERNDRERQAIKKKVERQEKEERREKRAVEMRVFAQELLANGTPAKEVAELLRMIYG